MKKAIFYSLISLILSSCTSNKPITSSLNPSEIKKVGILKPSGIVKILATNSSKEIPPEDVSLEMQLNVDEAIKSTFLSYKVNFEDANLSENETTIIEKEIGSYLTKMENTNSGRFKKITENFNFPKSQNAFKNIKVSQEVTNILKQKNLRFALSVVTIGFTRTKRNDDNRKLANAGKLILTTAAFLTTGIFLLHQGIPYQSTSYFFVIDAERQNLTMYNKKIAEIDPSNKYSIQGQINWGLEDYWVRHAMEVNRK
jgi:hypothetical protein